jgi:heme/copper-type cytochrome/quinol oxidase subunit 2
MKALFFAAAGVALVCQLAVLQAVVAGRAPASSPGRTARVAEIAWVVIPTIVLLALLFMTWRQLGPPVVLSPAAGVPA